MVGNLSEERAEIEVLLGDDCAEGFEGALAGFWIFEQDKTPWYINRHAAGSH